MVYYGKVKINNCREKEKRFIVARMVEGEWWMWGSWNERERAETACKVLNDELDMEAYAVFERVSDKGE